MAQTQTASRRRSRSQKKPSARSRGSSTKSTKQQAKKTKPATRKQPKGQNASKPSPVSAVENTAKEAGRTAKDAGKTVGRAASKAKVPLLAGGAALAGAAGGIALGAHQARRHKGLGAKVNSKVHSGDLAKAAKRVGVFGAQMGHFANELQRAREDSNANGHSRSPVEVVLEGLTTRRSRD
jgi:hypothetical protein